MRHASKSLIIEDGKYLLLKRSDDVPKYKDHWDFPGGRQEPGETPEQTLIRETKEEINLDVIPDKILKEFDYIFTTDNFALHFYIFSVKSYTGEIKISHEHKEYKWFSPDEIPDKLHPCVAKFFESNNL